MSLSKRFEEILTKPNPLVTEIYTNRPRELVLAVHCPTSGGGLVWIGKEKEQKVIDQILAAIKEQGQPVTIPPLGDRPINFDKLGWFEKVALKLGGKGGSKGTVIFIEEKAGESANNGR